MRSCLVCLTPETARGMDTHHLVKRSQGGYFGPTADLCRTCHDFVDNGDWEIYVNGDPVSMNTVLSGTVTVRKGDGSLVAETVHNIPTPAYFRPMLPNVEFLPEVTTREIAEMWDNTMGLERMAFAYQCLLAAITHKMAIKDEQWLRRMHPEGKTDWAKMMKAQISEAIGKPITAEALRQRAVVWETLEEELQEFSREQVLDYIVGEFVIKQTFFVRAAFCDREQGWTMVKALEWVNEEYLAGNHVSLRTFEKEIGYRKTELRWALAWSPYIEDWEEAIVSMDMGRKVPLDEGEKVEMEAKRMRTKKEGRGVSSVV